MSPAYSELPKKACTPSHFVRGANCLTGGDGKRQPRPSAGIPLAPLGDETQTVGRSRYGKLYERRKL